MFRGSFRRGFDGAIREKLADEELKLSVSDLRDLEGGIGDKLPDLFIQKRDISFQDMQSISRTFERYFDVSMTRDEVANDIIVGQASRHVIVHAGSKVDRKMMLQVSKANPRTLKRELREGMMIQYSVDEIHKLGEAMSRYLADLETKAISAVG